MVRKVYRALDHSILIFGIRGRFLAPFGIGAAASLVLAILVGTLCSSMFLGLLFFFIGVVAVYLYIQSLQDRVPGKELTAFLSRRLWFNCVGVPGPGPFNRWWGRGKKSREGGDSAAQETGNLI
mgnify:CR=1 FL=1